MVPFVDIFLCVHLVCCEFFFGVCVRFWNLSGLFLGDSGVEVHAASCLLRVSLSCSSYCRFARSDIGKLLLTRHIYPHTNKLW